MKETEAVSSNNSLAIEAILALKLQGMTGFIPRQETPKFICNLYSAGYLANLDSKGIGVPGAFKIGRQVCYPIESLINWLLERLDTNQALSN